MCLWRTIFQFFDKSALILYIISKYEIFFFDMISVLVNEILKNEHSTIARVSFL